MSGIKRFMGKLNACVNDVWDVIQLDVEFVDSQNDCTCMGHAFSESTFSWFE